MRSVTLAITTFNRTDLLKKSFEKVLEDERVNEIVLSDDASKVDVFKQLVEELKPIKKIKIYRNGSNQGVYRNKFHSVFHSSNPWVIVFDSDNIIGTDYIDELFKIRDWDPHTEYCPGKAEPDFDYTHISKEPITKENVNTLWKKKQFDAMLNTMNSFFNREEYLRVWKDDFEPISSDSIYMNYKWLAAGNKILIVPDLKYYHRIHSGSHYVNNCGRSMAIHKDVEQKLKNLK